MADLTSVAAVKAWLRLGNGHEELLARLVTAASAATETYLGRTVLQADYTERGNGTGGCSFLPKRHPINSVASLSIDGVAIEASDGIKPGYLIDGGRLVLVGGLRFTRGVQNILLTYNAGYATVPADIEQAVIETVALSYKRGDHADVSSKTLAGETVSYIKVEFPPSAKAALQPHRMVVPL